MRDNVYPASCYKHLRCHLDLTSHYLMQWHLDIFSWIKCPNTSGADKWWIQACKMRKSSCLVQTQGEELSLQQRQRSLSFCLSRSLWGDAPTGTSSFPSTIYLSASSSVKSGSHSTNMISHKPLTTTLNCFYTLRHISSWSLQC